MADGDLSKVDPFDAELFKYTNIVRKNPKALIPDLEEYLERFEENQFGERGLKFKREGGRSTIMTKEGDKAVLDAI